MRNTGYSQPPPGFVNSHPLRMWTDAAVSITGSSARGTWRIDAQNERQPADQFGGKYRTGQHAGQTHGLEERRAVPGSVKTNSLSSACAIHITPRDTRNSKTPNAVEELMNRMPGVAMP